MKQNNRILKFSVVVCVTLIIFMVVPTRVAALSTLKTEYYSRVGNSMGVPFSTDYISIFHGDEFSYLKIRYYYQVSNPYAEIVEIYHSPSR